MGQKNWAAACALTLALAAATTLTAQQSGDPFGLAPETTASEPGRPGPGALPSPEASPVPTDARTRIAGVLNEELREPLEFVQQPLRDVASILAETYDIPIQFDVAALDAVAASPDVEVSIAINHVSLRSALDLMLRNAGAEELTYIIDDEVLLITTHEEAESRMEVQVYRVDDLIGDGLNPSPYSADADALIDLIVASVEHESWMENGTGEGEINAFPPGMMIISQTHRVHEQVQQLLDDIRRNKAAIESATADSRAHAATQPVSRSIPINPIALAAEGATQKLSNALIVSADWHSANHEIDGEEKFLTVLKDRVLVRHLPHVVAQVERAVRDFELTPRRSGGSTGGGRGGSNSGGGMF